MNEDRRLIVHHNNGTKLEVTFPVQIKNSTAAVQEAMKRIMESDKLVIETGDRLIVIPWSSVKHVEVAPAPPAVPFGAIRNAKVVA